MLAASLVGARSPVLEQLSGFRRQIDWITSSAPLDRVDLATVIDQGSEERSRECSYAVRYNAEQPHLPSCSATATAIVSTWTSRPTNFILLIDRLLRLWLCTACLSDSQHNPRPRIAAGHSIVTSRHLSSNAATRELRFFSRASSIKPFGHDIFGLAMSPNRSLKIISTLICGFRWQEIGANIEICVAFLDW